MAMAATVPALFTNIRRLECKVSLPPGFLGLGAWPLTTFGNLFVANNFFDDPSQTFQGTIIKITPDGVQSLFVTIAGNVILEGLAFDRASNLFVIAIDATDLNGASTIYKITPGGYRARSAPSPSRVSASRLTVRAISSQRAPGFRTSRIVQVSTNLLRTAQGASSLINPISVLSPGRSGWLSIASAIYSPQQRLPSLPAPTLSLNSLRME
jgi:hypothetical protein